MVLQITEEKGEIEQHVEVTDATVRVRKRRRGQDKAREGKGKI